MILPVKRSYESPSLSFRRFFLCSFFKAFSFLLDLSVFFAFKILFRDLDEDLSKALHESLS